MAARSRMDVKIIMLLLFYCWQEKYRGEQKRKGPGIRGRESRVFVLSNNIVD